MHRPVACLLSLLLPIAASAAELVEWGYVSDPEAINPDWRWNCVREQALYVADARGTLRVYDLSSLARSHTGVQLETPAQRIPVGGATGVLCGDAAVYVFGSTGISSFDVSDPLDPLLVGNLNHGSFNYGVIEGDLLAVAGEDNVRTYSIADPLAPAPLAGHVLGADESAYSLALFTDRIYVFVHDFVANTDVLRVLDRSAAGVLAVANDVAAPEWLQHLYVDDGALFGGGDVSNGYAFDLSDPDAPADVHSTATWVRALVPMDELLLTSDTALELVVTGSGPTLVSRDSYPSALNVSGVPYRGDHLGAFAFMPDTTGIVIYARGPLFSSGFEGDDPPPP